MSFRGFILNISKQLNRMELKAINTAEELDQMLEWIDKQFDVEPALESPEGHKLQIALRFVKAYEDKQYPIH